MIKPPEYRSLASFPVAYLAFRLPPAPVVVMSPQMQACLSLLSLLWKLACVSAWVLPPCGSSASPALVVSVRVLW